MACSKDEATWTCQNSLSSYVSTGSLPPSDQVARLVAEAHERFGNVELGKNSQVYPALARVPHDLFGICVVGTDGTRPSRPATPSTNSHHERVQAVHLRAGLRRDRRDGRARAARRERDRPCLQFRSPASSAARTGGPTRWSMPARSPPPAWCRAQTDEEKWRFIHDGLSRFAGRDCR